MLALLLTLAAAQSPATWIPHCTTAELERIYFAHTQLTSGSTVAESLGIRGDPDPEVAAALARLTESLDATLATDLAEGGAWRTEPTGLRLLELAKPAVIDTIVITATGGGSLGKGRVEVRTQGTWREYYRGNLLGNPYTVRGEPLLVDGVRLWSTIGEPVRSVMGKVELHCSAPRVKIAPDWRLFEGKESVELSCGFPGAELELEVEGAEPQNLRQSGGSMTFDVLGTTTIRVRANVDGREPGPWAEATFVLADEGSGKEPLALFVAPKPGLEALKRNDKRHKVETGYINAPKAGVYRIGLDSEHPAWLELHGERLLVHPGQGLGQRHAAVALKAGWHPVHLETHAKTNTRPRPASLSWSGPGFDFRVPKDDNLGH